MCSDADDFGQSASERMKGGEGELASHLRLPKERGVLALSLFYNFHQTNFTRTHSMNRQHTQLIDRLEATGKEFIAAVGQIPEKQINAVPTDGEWSLHQALAHTRDTEANVFTYRTGLILNSKTPPTVANFSQEEYNVDHYSPKEPVKKILTEFSKARRQLVKNLRATQDSDWKRYAIHPEYGNIPIEYIALHAYTHTLTIWSNS